MGLTEMGNPLSTEKTVAGKVQPKALSYHISEIWGRKEPIWLVFPGGSKVQGKPRVEGIQAWRRG